jgi:hypothetical protein
VKAFFNNSWVIAKILDCRILKEFEDVKRKIEESYEYYIHYIDLNRKNDRWIHRKDLQVNDQKIEIELKERELREKEKKDNIFENNEHEGMDDTSLQCHEVKTIDEMAMGNLDARPGTFHPTRKAFMYLFYTFVNSALIFTST